MLNRIMEKLGYVPATDMLALDAMHNNQYSALQNMTAATLEEAQKAATRLEIDLVDARNLASAAQKTAREYRDRIEHVKNVIPANFFDVLGSEVSALAALVEAYEADHADVRHLESLIDNIKAVLPPQMNGMQTDELPTSISELINLFNRLNQAADASQQYIPGEFREEKGNFDKGVRMLRNQYETRGLIIAGVTDALPKEYRDTTFEELSDVVKTIVEKLRVTEDRNTLMAEERTALEVAHASAEEAYADLVAVSDVLVVTTPAEKTCRLDIEFNGSVAVTVRSLVNNKSNRTTLETLADELRRAMRQVREENAK